MLHSPLVIDGSKGLEKGNDLYQVTRLFMAKNLLTFKYDFSANLI